MTSREDSEQFQITGLPKGMKKKWRIEAAKRGLNVSQFVLEAVRNSLKHPSN